jgi:2-C-methyl-D-erythritol 4-phosphate cytidylyltransferase
MVASRTVGVVLAGGVGTRMSGTVPKQLLEIGGRPVISHTIAAFDRSPVIDDVLVVITPGHRAAVETIVAEESFAKVRRVLDGGATRGDSTWNALEALGDSDCDVLLHDAARPLVPDQVLRACVEALERFEAVAAVVPATDTVVALDGDVVVDIPDRSRLAQSQTPQGFRLATIRRAYELARADPGFTATDDCGVVRRYLPDVAIHVVPGSPRNLKITTPLDLALADLLLRRQPD